MHRYIYLTECSTGCSKNNDALLRKYFGIVGVNNADLKSQRSKPSAVLYSQPCGAR